MCVPLVKGTCKQNGAILSACRRTHAESRQTSRCWQHQTCVKAKKENRHTEAAAKQQDRKRSITHVPAVSCSVAATIPLQRSKRQCSETTTLQVKVLRLPFGKRQEDLLQACLADSVVLDLQLIPGTLHRFEDARQRHRLPTNKECRETHGLASGKATIPPDSTHPSKLVVDVAHVTLHHLHVRSKRGDQFVQRTFVHRVGGFDFHAVSSTIPANR